MAILTMQEVSFSYASTPVIKNAGFLADEGDRIGIVGPNGAGKTTLLKLITGELTPDSGSIYIKKTARLGYLEQTVESEARSVFLFCEEIFSDIDEIEKRQRELEAQMAALSAGGEASEKQLASVMLEYGELQEKFEELGGFEIKSRINAVLSGLKIPADQTVSALSGGERSKVAMARLLLRNPDILILDEPTNHLDIDSITWMEDFLSAYKGTLLVVSHDRYFLEKICTKILHFEFGSATMFRGGYKHAMQQIMEQKIYQQKTFEAQQKEIARQEGIIREFYSRATEKQIKKAKSRQKMLDKIERVKEPGEDRTSFNLKLSSSGRGGNDVLMLTDISKSFEARRVLHNATLNVFRGDKIGLIGANGAGKTTLFRIAMGKQLPDSGTVRHGTGIKIGCYEQNMDSLDWKKTILEEVHDSYPKLTISEVRAVLGAFMFKDDLDRKIGDISGGERSRVQLLKLMMSPANLLLLDEPTNHLDTYSKEILDKAIIDYEGSAIIISHDRFFLNEVCNKIAVLKDGEIEVFEGNYDDYAYMCSIRKNPERESEAKGDKPQMTKTALYKKRKAEKRGISKKAIEQKIMELEEEIAKLEEQRYSKEVYSDFKKSHEIEEAIETLKSECEKWYSDLID